MKKLILFFLLAVTGCASFQSGDVFFSRRDLWEIDEDKNFIPFSKINVLWKEVPYKSAIEEIGEGTVMPDENKMKPLPVKPEYLHFLKDVSQKTFTEAGIYDAKRGTGTINIVLTSYGRWTYKLLSKSFLIDTSFIMILPSSLIVYHHFEFECTNSSGTFKIEETARLKTAFHLLLFPLYPLLSPGAGERSMIRNALWKASIDIHSKITGE